LGLNSGRGELILFLKEKLETEFQKQTIGMIFQREFSKMFLNIFSNKKLNKLYEIVQSEILLNKNIQRIPGILIFS